MTHVDGPRTRSRVSLTRGDVPVLGFHPSAFLWRDVLGSEKPPRPPLAYCVPAPPIVAGADRVEQAVLVRVEAGGEVVLEHRLGVHERAFAGAIAAERARVAPALVELRPRWLARGVRSVTRGAATLPDRARRAVRKASAFLATPAGRARLRRGLVDPRALTGEEKAVTLFLGTGTLVVAILLAHVLVTLARPELAPAWRAGVLLFAWGYAGSLGAPLPWEPALLAGALALGAAVAVVVGLAAKLAAGYMVFFVGEAVNEKMEARAARAPRFARFLGWSERFASRFGLFAIALFIATPGLPDAIALYAFGALRMPSWKFFLGLALGALALDAALLLGALRFAHLG